MIVPNGSRHVPTGRRLVARTSSTEDRTGSAGPGALQVVVHGAADHLGLGNVFRLGSGPELVS